MWPARIFAYNLIIKEKGLINTPKSSIGARRGLSHTGTPGIQKICFQYVLFAVRFVIKKVIHANPKVTAIFPVTLTPNGLKPRRFRNHIKKNTVSKKAIYLLCFSSPILGIAISSLIRITIGSKNLPAPLAIKLFSFYDFSNEVTRKNINIETKRIEKTLFVIDKSKGMALVIFPASLYEIYPSELVS